MAYCSAPPVLPMDVIGSILEELRDDHTTLKHCALVCKDFLHPTRRHLFSMIKLTSAHTCCRLHEIVKRRSHLLCYVRRLEIITLGSGEWFISHSSMLTSIIRALHGQIAAFKLDLWPIGKSLNLWALDLGAAILTLIDSGRLDDVFLENVSFFPIQRLAKISRLRSLTLNSVYFELDNYPPESEALSLPGQPPEEGYLESLHLGSGIDVDTLVGVLTHPRSSLSLTSLQHLEISGPFADLLTVQAITYIAGEYLLSFTMASIMSACKVYQLTLTKTLLIGAIT